MRRVLEVQAAHRAARARVREIDLGNGPAPALLGQFVGTEQPRQAAACVAQALAPPSTVMTRVAGDQVELKADIRNYVYRGAVQLVTASLYQGQTTNFRTPGGGFAPVITLP